MKKRAIEFPPDGMGATIHVGVDVSHFDGRAGTYLQDPNVSLCHGVSPSFWKYKDGSITPMDADEKAEVLRKNNATAVMRKIPDTEFEDRVWELIKFNNQNQAEKRVRELEVHDLKFSHLVGGLSCRTEETQNALMEVSLRMKKLETFVMGFFVATVVTAIGIITEVFFGF